MFKHRPFGLYETKCLNTVLLVYTKQNV